MRISESTHIAREANKIKEPLPILNAENPPRQQMSEGRWLAQEIAKVTGPMPIVGGVVPTGTREGIPIPQPIGDDPELLAKTAHVRRPGERFLNQFIARTGLGPLQIRSLTPTELASRVATADRNNAESGLVFADPLPMPRRLTIQL